MLSVFCFVVFCFNLFYLQMLHSGTEAFRLFQLLLFESPYGCQASQLNIMLPTWPRVTLFWIKCVNCQTRPRHLTQLSNFTLPNNLQADVMWPNAVTTQKFFGEILTSPSGLPSGTLKDVKVTQRVNAIIKHFHRYRRDFHRFLQTTQRRRVVEN